MLQSRRPVARQGIFRDVRVHRRYRWDRRAAAAQRHPLRRPCREVQVLPGVDFGAVRAGARGAAARDHSLLPSLSVRRGEAVRLLDRRQLPRGVRHARVQRHSLQPRVAAPRAHVRHAQGYARCRPHLQRNAGLPVHGKHRRQARLGPRARLRADDVDHAAAGHPRRLRGRHRRDEHRAALYRARLQVRPGRHRDRLERQRGGRSRLRQSQSRSRARADRPKVLPAD
mmetsp:Transcript_48230/g.119459  ORF Transcript_48230/g.119459 Transcript_48230/m.119459 type:complete len:227 (+) Transcript_48230:340-1020(+)